jgi:tetratricopeptide (TPR) repeat protein
MEADSLYTEALAHTRRRDPDDLSIARILRERGDPLFNTGRQAEAEKSLREALAIYNRVYPGDHPDKSMCMFDLTDVLTDDAEIESLAIAHIDMERRLWGGKHPFMIESLGKLGYFYALRHRWAEAESLLRESLAIGEQLDEPDHISLGTACNDLASLLHGMERYKETLVLYRRAYDIWSRKLHPADPHVLMSRSNLATTLEKMGFDDEAWRLLEEGLAAAEADSATPYVAMYHKRMLEFLSAQKRHAEADEHARAALAYYRGNAHWIHAWAGCLKLQGHMLRSLGRLEEGELCHAEADSILRTDGRIATPGIENLRGWGRCLHEMGRLDDAYRRLKEAHDRFAEDYGKDHWFYSIHAVGLSEVEADRGEWAAAVEHANAGRSRLLALPNADSEDDPLSPAQRDHRSEFLERANRVLDRARAAGVEIPPEA